MLSSLIPRAAIPRDRVRQAGISWAVILLACLLSGSARATTLLGLISTGEVYASTDQGAHWTALAALPISDAVGIGAGSIASQLFLAGASGSLYKSTDAGATWTGVGAAPASDVVGLVITVNLNLLLLTGSGPIYQSTDQGGHFSGLASLTGSDFVGLAQVRSSQYVYALGRAGEVWQSQDLGASWAARGSITASDCVAIQALGGSLDVLTASGDLYASTDAGNTWQAVGTLSQVGMTCLTVDGTTLLAGEGTGEVASW